MTLEENGNKRRAIILLASSIFDSCNSSGSIRSIAVRRISIRNQAELEAAVSGRKPSRLSSQSDYPSEITIETRSLCYAKRHIQRVDIDRAGDPFSMTNSLLISVLLCLIVGSAIDTGNICVVRAAKDLTAGKPGVAVSCLLTVACAATVFYVDTVMGWHSFIPPSSYPTLLTVAGATIFTMGALLNGACAIGTIGRLARGDVNYAATFIGAILVALLLPARKSLATHPVLPWRPEQSGYALSWPSPRRC
jgi:uncharacterized membrane protein YedE/YeeE